MKVKKSAADEFYDLPSEQRRSVHLILYNLFQKYALHTVIDDWLIVNQALASETNRDSVNLLLMGAIQSAKQSSHDV
jgi:hypothetical protein